MATFINMYRLSTVMSYIRTKLIKGIIRHYLEHSFRLPDGKIKKVSKYLPNYSKKEEGNIIIKYSPLMKKKEEDILSKFVIQKYNPDSVLTKSEIEKVESMKQGYSKIIHKLTKNQFKDILDRFTVNFTYESNAIEGNSLTLKDVTIIIREGVVSQNKELREVYETVNTRDAVELMFNKKFKINEKDIIELHRILVKGTGVNFRYKKLPNFLLGRNVKTTPPEKVKEEMDKLIEWYNKDKQTHPLMKATLFHGRFEKIHPFEDGNGRVGRMLINIILMNNGYPPLIIRKTQRVKYFHSLQAFDDNYHGRLERFLLNSCKKTYRTFFEVYIQYI